MFDNYYIILSGKEYLVPVSVVLANEDLMVNKAIIKNKKTIFQIETLKGKDNYSNLKRICYHVVSSLGMTAMERDDDYLDVANNIRKMYSMIDDLAESLFNKGDYDGAYQKQLEGLVQALEVYNKIIQDDEKIDGKLSRAA